MAGFGGDRDEPLGSKKEGKFWSVEQWMDLRQWRNLICGPRYATASKKHSVS